MPASLDILRGAKAVADFMNTTPRRVYALHREGQIPTFMEGATICARKTSLIGWIKKQERG
jgi:hypothetical protein